MTDFQIDSQPPADNQPPSDGAPASNPQGDFANAMAQIAQNQLSQGQQFSQLLSALAPKEAPVAEKPFEYDVRSLLTDEEAQDRSVDLPVYNKIASGIAKTIMDKTNGEMAELRAQLATANAALTSFQSQNFANRGGDILFSTKEGKDYMSSVDPMSGLTRSQMAEAIARTGNTKSVESYLLASANAVKTAIERSKQSTVPKLGGGNVTITNADAQRVQRLNDEAAALRAKVAPISSERDRLMAINREVFALTNKAPTT